MKCQFCQNEADLNQVMAVRLCGTCCKKLEDHIAIICIGCDTLHWLPKTPPNVTQASRMSGELSPAEIMDHYVIHQIKSCRNCYEAAKEFTAQATWRN